VRGDLWKIYLPHIEDFKKPEYGSRMGEGEVA
jgi:hypothetical protein